MATVLETVVETPTEESDSELTVSSGDSVVLHGISWKLYRRLRKCRRTTIFV